MVFKKMCELHTDLLTDKVIHRAAPFLKMKKKKYFMFINQFGKFIRFEIRVAKANFPGAETYYRRILN